MNEGFKRIKTVLETLDAVSQSEGPDTTTQDTATGGSVYLPSLDELQIVGAEDGASGSVFSLEDLVLNLQQNLQSSDWLKEHTSDTWEQENQEMAEVFRKAREDASSKKQ